MEFESVGDIIASRMLHLIDENGQKRPVSVFVGKPQPSRDGPGYECPFQVIGLGSQTTRVTQGRDAIEALTAALKMLSANLHQLNDELGGSLFWEDSAPGEFGFL